MLEFKSGSFLPTLWGEEGRGDRGEWGGGGGDKRLKKSEHSIRSKWLQTAIRHHGDSGRGRRKESGGLFHSALLFLARFYFDELIH